MFDISSTLNLRRTADGHEPQLSLSLHDGCCMRRLGAGLCGVGSSQVLNLAMPLAHIHIIHNR